MPRIYPPRPAKPSRRSSVWICITGYKERGDQYIQVRVVVSGWRTLSIWIKGMSFFFFFVPGGRFIEDVMALELDYCFKYALLSSFSLFDRCQFQCQLQVSEFLPFFFFFYFYFSLCFNPSVVTFLEYTRAQNSIWAQAHNNKISSNLFKNLFMTRTMTLSPLVPQAQARQWLPQKPRTIVPRRLSW